MLHPNTLAACRTLAGSEPVCLTPFRASGVKPDWCHINVAGRIAKAGGEYAFGWHVFEIDVDLALFVFHACWRNRAGKLLDVTPLTAEYRNMGLLSWSPRWFLPDPARRLEFQGSDDDRHVYLGWKNRSYSNGSWAMVPSDADEVLDPENKHGERSLWVWTKKLPL